jgi:hypothetical protein
MGGVAEAHKISTPPIVPLVVRVLLRIAFYALRVFHQTALCGNRNVLRTASWSSLGFDGCFPPELLESCNCSVEIFYDIYVFYWDLGGGLLCRGLRDSALDWSVLQVRRLDGIIA